VSQVATRSIGRARGAVHSEVKLAVTSTDDVERRDGPDMQAIVELLL
jgi:hypothetical protein